MQWMYICKIHPSPPILKLSTQIGIQKCIQKKTLSATAFPKPSPVFHLSSVKKDLVASQCISRFFHLSISPVLLYHEQCLKLSKPTWAGTEYYFSLSMTSTAKDFKLRKMQRSEEKTGIVLRESRLNWQKTIWYYALLWTFLFIKTQLNIILKDHTSVILQHNQKCKKP